jgi:hypothetical protein
VARTGAENGLEVLQVVDGIGDIFCDRVSRGGFRD